MLPQPSLHMGAGECREDEHRLWFAMHKREQTLILFLIKPILFCMCMHGLMTEKLAGLLLEVNDLHTDNFGKHEANIA